jgi:hypothetical protein
MGRRAKLTQTDTEFIVRAMGKKGYYTPIYS